MSYFLQVCYNRLPTNMRKNIVFCCSWQISTLWSAWSCLRLGAAISSVHYFDLVFNDLSGFVILTYGQNGWLYIARRQWFSKFFIIQTTLAKSKIWQTTDFIWHDCFKKMYTFQILFYKHVYVKDTKLKFQHKNYVF